ncbi:cyclase family protein [Amycolatopsis acidiphila]|uniref:Cyclase family protein n=1 Tax=Amycolatopsis acidiphila TaxID=715473 RepID=A0A558AP09_9PSEU|nr:cyclase family protein [Amycolatopsis acidiphila]TVT25979.1 cyclase family protein [Amycolatopsis acidiphila]UIJ63307.1 cyclase family protein [Amycolatopsis acidiphila]GHG74931.1 cyclase [Amycolatopsis acidiphila]
MTGNWGRWGAEDQLGALNLVTPEVTRRAAGLVREGRTVSLAQPLGPASPSPGHRPRPARFMNRDAGDYALGARTPGGFKFAEDTVQFPTHSGTHVDALAHAWSGEHLYNGHPEASTRTTRGAQRCGAEHLAPVVTRGVLVDLVAAAGAPLPPSAPVEVEDLERGIAEAGVTPEPGDAILIRTGWWESHGSVDDYFADEPGITGDAAAWLAAHDVALVGADNYAVERQTAAPGFPAHLVLLHQHGVPLIENLDLAGLAAELAGAGRSTFLLLFAPLPLVGSTASPVTPVAVL